MVMSLTLTRETYPGYWLELSNVAGVLDLGV